MLATEIAERQRAEEELQGAIQSLRALIQASPLPIVSFDRDTNIQIWNPAAEKVFGWSEREVLDRPVPLVPEEGQEEFRFHWEQVLQGKVIPGLELPRQRKDGSQIRRDSSRAERSIRTHTLLTARGGKSSYCTVQLVSCPCPMTLPVWASRAAKSEVVPWRT